MVLSLAEEFREFTRDYIRTKERSHSLSPVDRNRLINILEYLQEECKDADIYKNTEKSKYENDRHFRRAMERWVENLVNASIDIAKIVLAAEDIPVPQTYRALLAKLKQDAVDCSLC